VGLSNIGIRRIERRNPTRLIPVARRRPEAVAPSSAVVAALAPATVYYFNPRFFNGIYAKVWNMIAFRYGSVRVERENRPFETDCLHSRSSACGSCGAF
jgi:hypothetical protein